MKLHTPQAIPDNAMHMLPQSATLQSASRAVFAGLYAMRCNANARRLYRASQAGKVQFWLRGRPFDYQLAKQFTMTMDYLSYVTACSTKLTVQERDVLADYKQSADNEMRFLLGYSSRGLGE